MVRFLSYTLFALLAAKTMAYAQTGESTAEVQRFQGSWRVTDLIEDGKVIPQEAIKTTLPSGGQAEIISNTIQFNSATAGRTAKVFSIDPTIYPKAIVISTLERPEGLGIYKFEGERLIICMADPATAQRPNDFSSRPGSKHMLIVLERAESAPNTAAQPPAATASQPQAITAPQPQPAAAPQMQTDAAQANTAPPATVAPQANPAPQRTAAASPGLIALPAPPAQAPAPTAATARILTDAEVTTMLQGSWRLNDGAGVLQVNFAPTGSFASYREVQDPTTFYRVFVQTPVSAGTWSVQNGNLIFRVASSTDPARVNQTFHVAVRSISQTDLIFVDFVGQVVKAVRLR